MTPTARTLAYYRKQGFSASVVEKWLPPRGTMKFGRRIDVWGFGDVLVCLPGWGVALIQCTSRSGGNYAAHKAKILAIPELSQWKQSGGRVVLVGWGKRGPRGKRKLWQIREEEL
jgi:hypothetical protein